jgi:hypothetical protein
MLSAASLLLPTWAAAQSTVTGRLVERLPGGVPQGFLFIQLSHVLSNGLTDVNFNINSCDMNETTDCIAADGTFNITNVSDGLYLLEIGSPDSVYEKFMNVSVSGATSFGDINLIRAPFDITVTVGQIPAMGGLIPVAARVRRRWNIPTLPVSARIVVAQNDINGGFERELPQVINYTWPTNLADSGVVPLPPILIAPSVPAGTTHCVELIITLQNTPEFELGRGLGCSGKRP